MPKHNAKKPEEIALWAEALDTGVGYAAVSREFGVAVATLRKYCPDKKCNFVTPADLANWEAALDEGYAYKHVGEVYNVHPQTVRKYFPGRGWTRQQVVEHGALMSRAGKNSIV